MSDQNVRLVVSGIILLHGLGHGGAFAALVWRGLRPGSSTGAWLDARSWLLPSLSQGTATAVASTFWIASLVGFVAAFLAFWSIVLPVDAWQPMVVGSAIVSALGIVLFFGTWPIFNMLAALGVNVAVMVALLVVHWTPPLA